MIQPLLWGNQSTLTDDQPLRVTSHPEKKAGLTQSEAILQHLQTCHSITALDALRLYGVFRLASRIHDLKRCGIAIESRSKTTSNGKKIAEYYLA